MKDGGTVTINMRTMTREGRTTTSIRTRPVGQAPRRKARLVGSSKSVSRTDVHIFLGDALTFYGDWPRPTLIVSDGPYGLGSYPGDPPTVDSLPFGYEPHIKAWSKFALPSTTLWFWNSELGWATVHPLLQKYDWEFRNCHIWDKGPGHVAGNANSKTLRKFPVVTEVCVQYVRKTRLPAPGLPTLLDLKDWLRHEWARTGLPFYLANEACGVANAATRKYLTRDHLWYFPPRDAFEKLVRHANKFGVPAGRPYFSADGARPLSGEEWEAMRAKFHCLFGVSNVWQVPPVNGRERIKERNAAVHLNQKPLRLMELIVNASSDPGDVVWEPFGGMCTAAIACLKARRQCYSAEILPKYFSIAVKRLEETRWAEQLPLSE